MSKLRFMPARSIIFAVAITLVVAFAAAVPHTAAAAPHDGNVVEGGATISGDNRTIDQHTRDAVIEWERFGISPGESVRFNQPDAQARILNRVVGGDLSEIAGELSATGIVYLTNPAGIIFTEGATIDVAGLYAAAGHISNADFLNANDHFHDLQGEVVNHGTISGRAIHLLGVHVQNHGTISVQNGVVTMLAGEDVLMHHVDGRVHIKIDGRDLEAPYAPATGEPTIDPHKPAIENTGTIEAQASQLTLGAGDMYALAVRNPGNIATPAGNATFAGRAIELNTDTIDATFQQYLGPVTLKQSISFDAISTYFADTLDAHAEANAYTNVTITGPATFARDVGAENALTSLSVNAAVNFAPTAEGNSPLNVRTLGDQSYSGSANILGDTALVANTDEGNATVHFADSINAGAPGSASLEIDADNVVLAGRVGAFRPLRELEVNADLIAIHSNLVRTSGDIRFNAAGRDEIPNAATIAAPAPAGGELTLETQGGDFVMGHHEKLSVVGDLTILAPNGGATLGDVSTLGEMRVTANGIELIRRESAMTLEADGIERQDAGVTYVAGGRFHFSQTPTAVGTGPDPVFASPLENPDANQTLPGVEKRAVGVTESDFFLDTTVLNLRHGSPLEDRRINLAEAFAEETEAPPDDQVLEEAMLGPEAWDAMNQLALRLRPIGAEALAQRLSGRHLIDDSATVPVAEVTAYRVRAEDARHALRQYFDIFIETERDAVTGEITVRDRTSHVRRTIDAAWQRYARRVDAEPTAVGFRAFIGHPDQAEARRYLHGLAAVLTDLRQVGISRIEYAHARDALLRRLDPQRITIEQLREVIRPLIADPTRIDADR